MSLEPGDIFAARYRVDGRLGAGGFGDVYVATDLQSQRNVALKVLTANDPQARARFQREVAIVAGLRSPHTVSVLDSGVDAGVHYAVFEYIEGADLDEVLERHGRLEPQVVEHILRQLLESLAEAHGQQLLHRDIKPANIRIFARHDDPWAVKLLDFGIARATDGGHPSLTATGELIGTPRYMSPEQLTEKPLTAASDIYSLGMVGFEMLAGSEAMQGGGWGEQISRLQTGYLPDLSGVASGRLGEVVLSMVRRHANERPGSAREVLALLDGEQLTTPVAAPAAPVERRRIWWLPLVAMIGLLAVGGWFAWHGNESDVVPNVPVRRDNPLAERAAPALPDLGLPRRAAQDAGFVELVGCGSAPPFIGHGRLPDGFGPTWATYVPRSYDATQQHPLVLLIHDDAQTGEELLGGKGLTDLADQRGYVLIAPTDPNWVNVWEGLDDTAQFVNRITETSATLCIDPARIFVVGQGTGSPEVYDLLCEPTVRAGATNTFTIDDGGVGRCSPRPLIAVHADESEWYPAAGGQNCNGNRRVSVDAIDKARRTFHRCRGDEESWFEDAHGRCKTWQCDEEYVSCVVHGGGSWPGTKDGRLNVDCEPKPATKFETTERVWAFFEGLDNLGCGVAPPFHGEGQLSAPDLTPWEVYIPKTAGSTPMPMLMLLHQSLGGPKRFLRGSGFVKLAEQHGIVLIAPNGGPDPWKGEAMARYLDRIAEETTKQLCIDKTRQFVVGHGQGGRAVETLACSSWADGIASNSHRSSKLAHHCSEPIPHITLAGLKTAHEPVQGGRNCRGFEKLSLADWERKWTSRNGCDEEPVELSTHGESTCFAFANCTADFVSCHLDGGHGWPGLETRPFFAECDGEPPDFPTAQTIWSFFEKI